MLNGGRLTMTLADDSAVLVEEEATGRFAADLIRVGLRTCHFDIVLIISGLMCTI